MSQRSKRVSRRGFVQSSTLAGTAMTAFHILPSKDARAAMPLKVGLLGCGRRGTGDTKRILQSNKGVTLRALGDLFPDRIETKREYFKEQCGAVVDDDHCFVGWDAHKKLLETDIDIVILTTSPVFRPMTLAAAIEAGKHVFMEKPAAVDVPGVKEVIAAGEMAERHGLSIVAGTQRRYQSDCRETMRRIHRGAIGDIVAARAYWVGGAVRGFSQPRPAWSEMEHQIRNWQHFLWLSGDHIVEQHVHNLDVINWAVGRHPQKAFGFGGRAWQQGGNIWDHHTVEYDYGDGLAMTSMCRQIKSPYEKVEEVLVGTKGSSNARNRVKGKTHAWEFEDDVRDGAVVEVIELVESIRDNRPINDAKQVAESTMTAILGRMAGYSGKLLTWDEAYQSTESYLPAKLEFGPHELRPLAIHGGLEYDPTDAWTAD